MARNPDSVFDRSGRLKRLIAFTDGTSNPQTTSYAYNGRGLQTIVTYEETGNVTHEYDAAGNMTKRTDEEAIAVDYKYDTANRLTERLKNGGTSDVEKYVYDGLGRLITAKKGTTMADDAVSRSVFAYDSLSRVISEGQAIAAGTAKSVNYTYDKAGNRVSLLRHGGEVTATYSYDIRERCTRISHNGSTLADYTWLGNALNKRETTCDYPGGTKPKFKSEYQRDGIGRISKLTNEHLTADQAGSNCGDLGNCISHKYRTASAIGFADDKGNRRTTLGAVALGYQPENGVVPPRAGQTYTMPGRGGPCRQRGSENHFENFPGIRVARGGGGTTIGTEGVGYAGIAGMTLQLPACGFVPADRGGGEESEQDARVRLVPKGLRKREMYCEKSRMSPFISRRQCVAQFIAGRIFRLGLDHHFYYGINKCLKENT